MSNVIDRTVVSRVRDLDDEYESLFGFSYDYAVVDSVRFKIADKIHKRHKKIRGRFLWFLFLLVVVSLSLVIGAANTLDSSSIHTPLDYYFLWTLGLMLLLLVVGTTIDTFYYNFIYLNKGSNYFAENYLYSLPENYIKSFDELQIVPFSKIPNNLDLSLDGINPQKLYIKSYVDLLNEEEAERVVGYKYTPISEVDVELLKMLEEDLEYAVEVVDIEVISLDNVKSMLDYDRVKNTLNQLTSYLDSIGIIREED